jgi:hypothetical protein
VLLWATPQLLNETELTRESSSQLEFTDRHGEIGILRNTEGRDVVGVMSPHDMVLVSGGAIG